MKRRQKDEGELERRINITIKEEGARKERGEMNEGDSGRRPLQEDRRRHLPSRTPAGWAQTWLDRRGT